MKDHVAGVIHAGASGYETLSVTEPEAIAIIAREVVFIGPGRVAFSMTRAAATETHKRLTEVLGLD